MQHDFHHHPNIRFECFCPLLLLCPFSLKWSKTTEEKRNKEIDFKYVGYAELMFGIKHLLK